MVRSSTPDTEPRKIPGYTGFLRGQQHVFAKTYGDLSVEVKKTVPKTLASPAPEGSWKLDATQIHGFPEGQYHVPGYGGHVHGIRENLSKTFGEATRAVYGSPVRSDAEIVKRPSVTDTLPGYGGFVPHSKDEYGKRFKEVATLGFGDHHPYSPVKAKQERSQRALGETTSIPPTLPSTSKKPPPHMPGTYPKPDVPDAEGKKVPGYSGHVDRGREITGLTYGEGTKRAAEGANLIISEGPSKEKHVIPGYKGHVPGKKETIGTHLPEGPSSGNKSLLERQKRMEGERPTSSSKGVIDAKVRAGRKHIDPSLNPPRDGPPEAYKKAERRIPGYAGYVRGKQHAFGRTFGDSTNELLTRGAPFPERPMSANATMPVPGYGGFIPNNKDICATRFGDVVQTAFDNDKRNELAQTIRSQTSPQSGLRPSTPDGRLSTRPESVMMQRKSSADLTRRPASANARPASQAINRPVEDGHGFKRRSKVPGYGGFIRGGQHVFGKTYASAIDGSREVYASRVPDFDRLQASEVPDASMDQTGRYAIDSHLPGYMGFVPEIKDECGQTYGEVTHKLINEHSKASIGVEREGSQAQLQGARQAKEESRSKSRASSAPPRRASTTFSTGSNTWVPPKNNIPGYTGFMRGQQHVFGQTYGRGSSLLKSSDAVKLSQQPTDFHPDAPPNPYAFPFNKGSRPVTPVTPVNPAARGKENKQFHVPGYGGFVHNSREIHALPYGTVTKIALNNEDIRKYGNPDKIGQRQPREQSPVCGYGGYIKNSKDIYGKNFQTVAELSNKMYLKEGIQSNPSTMF